MIPNAPNTKISFAEFELDTVHRRLLRSGETVALNAKAFDLLAFLANNNGRIVSKDEILNAVWDGQFVEESNLVVQISNLRRALGESKNAPRFLVTVPGKGYKFVAETNGNGFLIETHTISELTIEHEETVDQWLNLPEKQSSNRKWFAIGAVTILVFLTVGAIGYWRYHKTKEQTNFAFDWTNPSQRILPRQLTANGKMNVAAISPDGTLYAYTTEGSELSGLWVSGITGTQTIEVLPPSVITFTGLTFSPDGLYIYYTARDKKNQQGALFRVPTLGGLTEKVLSNVNRPITFSPNGKQFAFPRVDNQRKITTLVIAETNGSHEEKEIAARPRESTTNEIGAPWLPEGFNENGASWSPDGTKIAIGGNAENPGENALLLVDVKTGSVEKLGEKTWAWVRRVEWLPDSSGLFLNVVEKGSWQERQIWLIDYPGGQAHKITNDLNRYGGETVGISADGTKLIGVRAQTISNIFVGSADDVTRLTNITNNAVGKRDGAFNSLTWTPDGRLVFRRFFDKDETLWIMDADGTNAKQLTPNGFLDRKPVISNDGRAVVFDSNRSGNYNIWRVGLDGSDLKQITTGGGISPSITPDGNWIFYERGGYIWKIPIDGGEPVQMTDKASKSVEVSPDGKMFACFYRPVKGDKLKLAVFPIDGGEPLYLFDVPVDLLYEKLRWTPDSGSLVYAFYNSTAWKQSLSGGAPEKFLEFPGEIINAFSWSFDGKQFAVAHGQEVRDVVLFTIER